MNIVQHHGINARFIDLCGFQDTEYLSIDERIIKAFSDLDCSSTIPIATGYTKGTEGIMREFDRGYSEVTFSKIAVTVNADEAVIHKEYHLSTADPLIVGLENSRPVGFTNYNVADQLADLGMEAIHPGGCRDKHTNQEHLRARTPGNPHKPGIPRREIEG